MGVCDASTYMWGNSCRYTAGVLASWYNASISSRPYRYSASLNLLLGAGVGPVGKDPSERARSLQTKQK